MNKRPGHVEVFTEVGYCSFCDRTRNLRREEHHLGTLVRTIVTCETCHRTLSSSIGVAQAEPAAADEPAEVQASVASAGTAKTKSTPARRTPAKDAAKTASAKLAPAKRAPAKRTAKAATRTGKPTSTATRKATKNK